MGFKGWDKIFPFWFLTGATNLAEPSARFTALEYIVVQLMLQCILVIKASSLWRRCLKEKVLFLEAYQFFNRFFNSSFR
jgi:hypothetical protein